MRKLLLIIGVSLILISVVVSIVVVMNKDSSKQTPSSKSPAPLVPSDFQMYGDWVGFGNWIQVQNIAFVPSINQNVFMGIMGSDLKMVSQDNTQARFTPINTQSDTASQLFDASKWNTDYQVADSHYKVIKISDYEMYGPGISTPKTVQAVSYDPTTNKLIFMIIDNGLLKMVAEDNSQSRDTPASSSDLNTIFSLYGYDYFNSRYNNPGVGTYNVRRKN